MYWCAPCRICRFVSNFWRLLHLFGKRDVSIGKCALGSKKLKKWKIGRIPMEELRIAKNHAVGRCRLHIRCLISFLSLFVLLYLSIFVFLYLCIIAFEQPVGRRPQSRRLSSFSIWTGTLWRPTVRCRVPPAQVISTAAPWSRGWNDDPTHPSNSIHYVNSRTPAASSTNSSWP